MERTCVLLLKSKISHFLTLHCILIISLIILNHSALITESHRWGKACQKQADDICSFVGVNNKFRLEKKPA